MLASNPSTSSSTTNIDTKSFPLHTSIEEKIGSMPNTSPDNTINIKFSSSSYLQASHCNCNREKHQIMEDNKQQRIKTQLTQIVHYHCPFCDWTLDANHKNRMGKHVTKNHKSKEYELVKLNNQLYLQEKPQASCSTNNSVITAVTPQRQQVWSPITFSKVFFPIWIIITIKQYLATYISFRGLALLQKISVSEMDPIPRTPSRTTIAKMFHAVYLTIADFIRTSIRNSVFKVFNICIDGGKIFGRKFYPVILTYFEPIPMSQLHTMEQVVNSLKDVNNRSPYEEQLFHDYKWKILAKGVGKQRLLSFPAVTNKAAATLVALLQSLFTGLEFILKNQIKVLTGDNEATITKTAKNMNFIHNNCQLHSWSLAALAASKTFEEFQLYTKVLTSFSTYIARNWEQVKALLLEAKYNNLAQLPDEQIRHLIKTDEELRKKLIQPVPTRYFLINELAAQLFPILHRLLEVFDKIPIDKLPAGMEENLEILSNSKCQFFILLCQQLYERILKYVIQTVRANGAFNLKEVYGMIKNVKEKVQEDWLDENEAISKFLIENNLLDSTLGYKNAAREYKNEFLQKALRLVGKFIDPSHPFIFFSLLGSVDVATIAKSIQNYYLTLSDTVKAQYDRFEVCKNYWDDLTAIANEQDITQTKLFSYLVPIVCSIPSTNDFVESVFSTTDTIHPNMANGTIDKKMVLRHNRDLLISAPEFLESVGNYYKSYTITGTSTDRILQYIKRDQQKASTNNNLDNGSHVDAMNISAHEQNMLEVAYKALAKIILSWYDAGELPQSAVINEHQRSNVKHVCNVNNLRLLIASIQIDKINSNARQDTLIQYLYILNLVYPEAFDYKLYGFKVSRRIPNPPKKIDSLFILLSIINSYKINNLEFNTTAVNSRSKVVMTNTIASLFEPVAAEYIQKQREHNQTVLSYSQQENNVPRGEEESDDECKSDCDDLQLILENEDENYSLLHDDDNFDDDSMENVMDEEGFENLIRAQFGVKSSGSINSSNSAFNSSHNSMNQVVENALINKTISPIAPILPSHNINNDSIQMDLDALVSLMEDPNPSIEQKDTATDLEVYEPAEPEIDINSVPDSVVYQLAKHRGGLSTALIEAYWKSKNPLVAFKTIWLETWNIQTHCNLSLWMKGVTEPKVIFVGYDKHWSVVVALPNLNPSTVFHFDSIVLPNGQAKHAAIYAALSHSKPQSLMFTPIHRMLQTDTISCGAYAICFAEQIIDWNQQRRKNLEELALQWTIVSDKVEYIIICAYRIGGAIIYESDLHGEKLNHRKYSNTSEPEPKRRKTSKK